MKLYITGATGFLGRFVTEAALRRGHSVRAVVRPASSTKTASNNTDYARVDLRDGAAIDATLDGVDAVIHLAAAKAGDFHTQFAGTVVTTENLLNAMERSGIQRLVGVSTFSVYEYSDVAKGALVDETSPTVSRPDRDEYTETKHLQEQLYRAFAEDDDHHVVILRPGMIYGPHELWHALLGSPMGPKFLRIGSKSTLPMTYVENCAEAMVAAAERAEHDAVDGQIINVVDDDLPTQDEYVAALQRLTDTPESVTIPWVIWRSGAALAQKTNDLVFDGRAKMPGLLVPRRLDARFKPLTYTNAKAKRLLDWSPTYRLPDALTRSLEVERQEAATSEVQG